MEGPRLTSGPGCHTQRNSRSEFPYIEQGGVALLWSVKRNGGDSLRVSHDTSILSWASVPSKPICPIVIASHEYAWVFHLRNHGSLSGQHAYVGVDLALPQNRRLIFVKELGL